MDNGSLLLWMNFKALYGWADNADRLVCLPIVTASPGTVCQLTLLTQVMIDASMIARSVKSRSVRLYPDRRVDFMIGNLDIFRMRM